MGQLLFRLKYRNDQSAIQPMIGTIAGFLAESRSRIDAIVPVPPSNARPNQPVMMIADALGRRLDIPVCRRCVRKVRKTPQLKDIHEYHERVEAVNGAFSCQFRRDARQAPVIVR
jgi:predicted amidophosphoribosyltransferase